MPGRNEFGRASVFFRCGSYRSRSATVDLQTRDHNRAAAERSGGQSSIRFGSVVEAEGFHRDVEDAGVRQVDQFDQLVAGTPVRNCHRSLVRTLEEPDLGVGLTVTDPDDGDVGSDTGDGHRGVMVG